jgi:hypothetical protein
MGKPGGSLCVVSVLDWCSEASEWACQLDLAADCCRGRFFFVVNVSRDDCVGGGGGRQGRAAVCWGVYPSLTFARALDVLHGHGIASRRREHVAQEVACLFMVGTWLAGTLVLFLGEGDDRADGSIAQSTGVDTSAAPVLPCVGQ